MKLLTLGFLSVLAVGVSWGQSNSQAYISPRTRLRFENRPGITELTGRMLVRPLQLDAQQRMGIAPATARLNRQIALDSIRSITLRMIDGIDCAIVQVPDNMTEDQLASQLMRTGLYEYAEPDFRVFPQFTPNDPLLGGQWSHFNNDCANAWDICMGNPAVTIAITDTGVHVSHEDLITPRVLGANSATGLIRTEADFGPSIVKDIHGHGTHTSGIACASGGNALGVAGVNIAGTREMMVRVSDNGGSTSLSALITAALWAAQNGARIVSTSFSGVQNSSIGSTGMTLKNNYNTLWFYAAGNDAGNYGTFWDYPGVMIIGSIDSNNARSGFSAYGVFTDCFAPGGDILSTTWYDDNVTNSYGNMSGTSMATPYAAGVGALVLSENPAYSADRVADIVTRSSVTMGDSNLYGWGRVNAWNALGRVPDNYEMLFGKVVSGDATSLNKADGVSLVLAPSFVPNPYVPKIQFFTTHAVPNYGSSTIGEIDVLQKMTVSTAMSSFIQECQILNQATGQYESLGVRPVDGSMSEYVKTLNATNAADYIQNGTIKIKTVLDATGFLPVNNWKASYDQIIVRSLRLSQ